MKLIEDIIDNHSDFIWEVDTHGTYTYVSIGIENILGFSEDEVLGKKPFDFMEENESKKIKYQLKKRLISSPKFKYLKSKHLHKKGHEIILESSGTPILDKKQNIIGYRGINKDISYKNSLENSLIKKSRQLSFLTKKLEELVIQNNIDMEKQAKTIIMGEMLENIIHQWRQPLSTICTASSGLIIQQENNLLNDKNIHDSLSLIKDTSLYLSDVVEDFRSFYKDGDEKRFFHINEIFERTFTLLPKEFKEIKVIKDIDDIELYAYDTKIVQIFMNIYINSNDEFKRNKIKKKYIFINVHKDENFCVIKIKDNAGGIKKDILDKILNCRITTKKEGTGLGLCLCKEILSKHLNGTIKVLNKSYSYNEKKYVGAEFIIKVPINIQNKEPIKTEIMQMI